MRRRLKFILPFLALLLTMTPKGAVAENEHGHHEAAHSHRLELFLGNTHEDSEDGFSVGLAYEYRITEILGTGGLVEYAGGDLDKWLAGVPLFIHPHKGWRFVLAPGLEHKHSENEFLFRAGVAYEFEIGRWSITPEFNVDFVEGEEALVYGLSFGYGF